MQFKGAIQISYPFRLLPFPAAQQNLIGQFAAAQTLERTAQQIQAHAKQLPGIAVERLDAAALIQHHQSLVQHFKHGLLFFQQGLQRHLPRNRFGCGLDGAQSMEMKPAGLCGQGQHGQCPTLGIPDRRGGTMHAPPTQVDPEVFLGQHIHQSVFGKRQPRAVGALHRLQQLAAHRREIEAAGIQHRSLGIGQIDMTSGVVRQQSAHDLRCRCDQCAIGCQRRGQVGGGDKPVHTILRVEASTDAAQPGVPNHLPDPGRSIDTPPQTRQPGLFQLCDRSFVQRRRSDCGDVIEVLRAEGHRLWIHSASLCSYFRHVSIDMSSE
ncbi:hypothetical protein D3C71_998300 [compost metagenome]